MNIIVNKMTTAIACINTNRNYICIEKDNEYYNKSLDRIEKHLKAKKEENDTQRN